MAKGSPANAGIDPFRLAPSPLAARFPRQRGDRPARDWCVQQGKEVPPPTRG